MAFDPDNPTFYGECLPVDGARDITGTAIATKAVHQDEGDWGNGNALIYYWSDRKGQRGTDVQRADAGDSFALEVYPEYTYLQPDSPVEFTAVVEFGAGTAGQIRLSAGSDPSWDYTVAAAGESLGTFDAAPGQLRAPITSWTAPLIYNRAEQPILFVEVLSGHVEIRQVRVRMWPPGGASGAWVPDGTFEQQQPPSIAKSQGTVEPGSTPAPDQVLGDGGWDGHVPAPGIYGGWDDYGDTLGTFQEMTSALAGAAKPSYQAFEWSSNSFFAPVAQGSFEFGWTLREGSPGHDWGGVYRLGMLILFFEPRVKTTSPGGVTFADPDRIPWDDAAGVRDAVTRGAWKSEFSGWGALPHVDAAGENSSHIGVRVASLPDPVEWDADVEVFTGTAFNRHFFTNAGFATGAGAYPGAIEGDLALAGANVLIEVSPDYAHTAPGGYDDLTFSSDFGLRDFAIGSRTVDAGPARQVHAWTGGERFDPAATPAPEMAPRFFVKHRDDTMRPVGFGKPATELTLFRVPGRGRWRDLTTDEYVTFGPTNRPPGGMPLKVKRLDASGAVWWDHVGWMVPDGG